MEQGPSNIQYRSDIIPSVEKVIELYNNAGLSRCITDWVWGCYPADLAVRKEYHASGAGKKLIGLTKEKLGDHCLLLLLSVPSAMGYYPKVGFTKQDSSFIVNRKK